MRLLAGSAVATERYFLGLNKEVNKAITTANKLSPKINFHHLAKTEIRSGMK
jgi:hypothetical protein